MKKARRIKIDPDRWEAITEAIALLRGNPHFEDFLDAVRDVREAAVLDNTSLPTVSEHAQMAFNSGVVHACETIIQISEGQEKLDKSPDF